MAVPTLQPDRVRIGIATAFHGGVHGIYLENDGGYHRRGIVKILLRAFGGSEGLRDESQITVGGYERWCQLWNLMKLTAFDFLELSDVLGASQKQLTALFVNSTSLKPSQDLSNIAWFSFAYEQ